VKAARIVMISLLCLAALWGVTRGVMPSRIQAEPMADLKAGTPSAPAGWRYLPVIR